MMNARTISVSIRRPPAEVYEYASDPAHMPHWAPGFVKSVILRDGAWIAETTLGQMKLEFAARNDYGVLDHEVSLPAGEVFVNPMRVVANGEGSEVLFTVFQREGFTEAQFADDVKTVLGDLEVLKMLIEAS